MIPPDLAERYLAGEPVETLAAEAGVSASTIYQRLRRMIGPLRGRRTAERRAAIAAAAAQGEALHAEIGQHFGISRQRVGAIVAAERRGVPTGDRLMPPDLAERFLAGVPVATLAAEAGVSASTIYRRLYQALGPLGGRRTAAERRAGNTP